MAAIRVKCTSCGTRLKAKESLAGKKTKCPKCNTILVVPEPSASPGDSIESVAAALLARVQETPSRLSNTVPSQEIINGILFVCPFCDERYQVALEMGGRSILCRNCRASAKVPLLAEPDDSDFLLERKGKKQSDGETSIMSMRGMPKELMRDFKAWCMRHEITMKDQITEMIRECIKRK